MTRPELVRARALSCPLEHDEQVALVAWARLEGRRRPELALLVAIPNGGHRHPAVAGKLRAEGVSAGFPDLFLPAARGPYHGCFIELKRRQSGNVTRDQHAWHEALRAQGYRVEVCRGWDAARAALLAYLAHPASSA